jgi:hypothetical protein
MCTIIWPDERVTTKNGNRRKGLAAVATQWIFIMERWVQNYLWMVKRGLILYKVIVKGFNCKNME